MRKFFSVLIAVAICMSCCSCGILNSGSGNGGGTKETGFRIAIMDNEVERKTIESIISGFKKLNPDVTEKIEIVSYSGDYLTSLVQGAIKDKFEQHISLKDIAKRAYTSPNYFSKLFKQHVGISLIDFITDCRIKRACELLNMSEYSIVAIMNLVGYNDSKFFYNLFKRKTGITPGEYRQSHKK